MYFCLNMRARRGEWRETFYMTNFDLRPWTNSALLRREETTGFHSMNKLQKPGCSLCRYFLLLENGCWMLLHNSLVLLAWLHLMLHRVCALQCFAPCTWSDLQKTLSKTSQFKLYHFVKSLPQPPQKKQIRKEGQVAKIWPNPSTNNSTGCCPTHKSWSALLQVGTVSAAADHGALQSGMPLLIPELLNSSLLLSNTVWPISSHVPNAILAAARWSSFNETPGSREWVGRTEVTPANSNDPRPRLWSWNQNVLLECFCNCCLEPNNSWQPACISDISFYTKT